MNSEEIPQKFTDWLFFMGCPPEDIPPIDKIKQMCRGQYYMVWHNLLNKVQSAQIVKEKRLQVFCDDIRTYGSLRSGKEKHDTYLPEQLILWRQHNNKKQEVNLMENRITQMKQEFDHIMDKALIKMSQRNTVRRRCQDIHRRVWLLQNLSLELSKRRESLLSTKNIAHTLGPAIRHEEVDIEKCLSLLSKNTHSNNPSDSTSTMSVVNDTVDSEIEDQLQMLVSNNGGNVWTELSRRRAALVDKLSIANANAVQKDNNCGDQKISSKAVLTENYALYTLLSLDTLRNRIQIKNIQENLASTISNFDNVISSESRELLVLRCERVRADARAAALRAQHELLANAQGVFKMCYTGEIGSPEAVRKRIMKIHHDMEVKRDELNKLLCALSKTDIKILNVKENLQAIFRRFQEDQPAFENNISQTSNSVPIQENETVSDLRCFYKNKVNEQKQKTDCSMDFNMSESFTDTNTGIISTKFTDELKFYLNNFKLEYNQKIVLDTGEPLWVFETLQALLLRYHEIFNTERTGLNICPFTSIVSNLTELKEVIPSKNMEQMINKLALKNKETVIPDVIPKIEDGQKTVDIIKKTLKENISKLEKVKKVVQHSQDNLKFWEENESKKYISNKRTIDGNTYEYYEALMASTNSTSKGKTRQTWDKVAMANAIKAIRDKQMGFLKASKTYGVPKTTLIRLSYRISSPYKQDLETSIQKNIKKDTPKKAPIKTPKKMSKKKTAQKKRKISKERKSSSASSDKSDYSIIYSTDESPDRSQNENGKLYFKGLFSEDIHGEKWIQCASYRQWAHEDCAGIEEMIYFYVCELCTSN